MIIAAFYGAMAVAFLVLTLICPLISNLTNAANSERKRANELLDLCRQLRKENESLSKQLDAANDELAFDSRVQSLQEQLSVVITERDQLRLQVEANDEGRGLNWKIIAVDCDDGFAERHDSIGVIEPLEIVDRG